MKEYLCLCVSTRLFRVAAVDSVAESIRKNIVRERGDS